MKNLLPKLATRAGVAVLALLLAGGTAFAATAMTLAPARAERPSGEQRIARASESPEPSESAEPSESPEASESPEPSESAEPSEASAGPETVSAANVDRIVARLAAAGITTTADDFSALAAKVGVGGAVRILSFARASGKTADEILAMFQAGKGWGQVARELKVSVGPGIGWIMGKGHAAKTANGHGLGAKRGHGNQ